MLSEKLKIHDLHCELRYFDMDTFTDIDMVEDYLNK